MRLLPFGQRRTDRSLRLPKRELAVIRRWLEASASAELAGATPCVADSLRLPPAERRGADRQQLRATAEVRPISAGGIGLVRPALVRDVSPDGIALRLSEALPAGQRVSLELHPPSNIAPRRFRRADRPVHLLAIIRYCRPEGDGFVAGCSIGIEWADSLANEMFPPDLRRRTA